MTQTFLRAPDLIRGLAPSHTEVPEQVRDGKTRDTTP